MILITISLSELSQIRQTHRKGRGRGKRVRKQKRKIKEKQNKTKQQDEQQQVMEYGTRKYKEDKGLGARITHEKYGSEFRVFLQNQDGVMATGKELDNRRAMLTLKEWDVDVLSLPEKNRNWKESG